MNSVDKIAKTEFPIIPLAQNRWSPRAFSERNIESFKLNAILEAARWAPSPYFEKTVEFFS
ncbi:MAG: nitroreductase family protein [Bacteroidales bacterium]|nr:nitroreductase family protein [Bacteroidales bacterium]